MQIKKCVRKSAISEGFSLRLGKYSKQADQNVIHKSWEGVYDINFMQPFLKRHQYKC